MNFHHVSSGEEAQGQATFEMANLRTTTTGLPFIVFISQRDGAQHDVRVKVSPAPKVRVDLMTSYSLRPYRRVGGPGLSPDHERLLERWIELNLDVLVSYWDGDIEFTEDAIDQIRSI